MEKINASELKARLLAVLDRVKESGESVLVLKRGRPVARLVPPAAGIKRSAQAALRGTVEINGAILDPVVSAEHWEALSEQS